MITENRRTVHRAANPEWQSFEMIGAVLAISFGTCNSLESLNAANAPKVLIFRVHPDGADHQ